MSEGWISILTGLLTLIGVCVTAWSGVRRTGSELTQRLQTAQAVTDCKLESLAAEVRRHNDFARRLPVLEEQVRQLQLRGGAGIPAGPGGR